MIFHKRATVILIAVVNVLCISSKVNIQYQTLQGIHQGWIIQNVHLMMCCEIGGNLYLIDKTSTNKMC